MNYLKISLLFAVLMGFANLNYAQRGKDGSLTVSTANNIINTYTFLTVNAAANDISITVDDNSMAGGVFGGNLAAGDLIMIIQMQGATINHDPVFGSYSTPCGFTWNGNWFDHAEMWGSIGTSFGGNGCGGTSYNNAGKYEQVEVLSVAGGNTINLQCGLQNNYTAAGHVQVVRVPRFDNLSVTGGANSIIPTLWNGSTGGVVAIEVDQNLDIAGGSSISASEAGFRGGDADAVASYTGVSGTPNEVRFLGAPDSREGSEKGESIAGFYPEYDAIISRYGISAPANGGGGGGYQNCGGGGGSNIHLNTAFRYTGTGVPDQGGGAYTDSWNLDITPKPMRRVCG